MWDPKLQTLNPQPSKPPNPKPSTLIKGGLGSDRGALTCRESRALLRGSVGRANYVGDDVVLMR